MFRFVPAAAGFVRFLALAAALTLASAAAAATLAAPLVLDSGDTTQQWTAIASPGATARLDVVPGRDGSAIAFSFDLHRGKTHVIARRALSLDLPQSYRLVLDVEADCEPNTLEIKLVSGENVWWVRLPDYEFPRTWKELPIADSRVSFAWGPAGGGMPVHLDAIELAVSAGNGGSGTLRIDGIRIEPRDGDAASRPPIVTASSNAAGAAHLVDGDDATSWTSDEADRSPWIELDFRETAEQGGLQILNAPDGFARAYAVDTSPDRSTWTEVRRFTQSDGGLDDVYMPEVYARYIRIRWTLPPGARAAIREIRAQPYEYSSSPNAFFTAIARRAPKGRYPRYFSGEQSYWTLAGVAGADDEALVNEEGTVEVAAGGFTLEPFVFTDGRLRTWADATTSVSLEDGDLPIPNVVRRDDEYTLSVTAFAAGAADAPTLYVRYRLTALRGGAFDLFAALRPFQVLPPWQALNRTGGVAKVSHIERRGDVVHVDDRRVIALTPPGRFGAASFEQGDISSFLERGILPDASSVEDAFSRASAAWSWRADLEAGQASDVWLAVPWKADSPVAAKAGSANASADLERAFVQTKTAWRDLTGAAGLELPARGWTETLRANLAYILINRDGARIQPGSRTYERSWIRDGAMTSAALLELGFDAEVKDYLRWYARYVSDDGQVPCCVDSRGADPVPENDSYGEFIWAVAETWRFTRDESFVREMWPKVRAVARCMTRLRDSRRTPEFQAEAKRSFYGLLPESISHEGYSARPVHAYWDQSFALRGFIDAAELASVVGDGEEHDRQRRERNAFATDLRDSVRRTIAEHRLDVVPASVELGDFDPTSTAVSFQLGIDSIYPREALDRSFAKYAADFHARRSAARARGVGYTAYELRNAVALVSLGRRPDAVDLLGDLVADTRPAPWHGWPEISWLDAADPSFLGDLPHTWIGSTFVHAVRSLLVTETGGFRMEAPQGDDAGSSPGTDLPTGLLVASGVPLEWLESGGIVRARALPTWFGPISVEIARSDTFHAREHEPATASAERGTDVVVAVAPAASEGKTGRVRPFTSPDGGIRIAAPFGADVLAAQVNGVGANVENATVRIGQLPATVVFQYKPRLEDPRERADRNESRRGSRE